MSGSGVSLVFLGRLFFFLGFFFLGWEVVADSGSVDSGSSITMTSSVGSAVGFG